MERRRESCRVLRSLITGQDEMCFWQEKSRIANKWSGRGGPRVALGGGIGGRDINGRSGTHKAREIYGKRQFMMVGKKITV